MSFPKDTEYLLEPGSKEAHDFLWSTNGTTIELTHNYGTEKKEGRVYHPGNEGADGFGHLAVACDDVYAACADLEAQGVVFKKKPDEGRMKVVSMYEQLHTMEIGKPEHARACQLRRVLLSHTIPMATGWRLFPAELPRTRRNSAWLRQ